MGALHATMNISVDGCCHHTQVVADDEFHAAVAELFGGAEALLFGRTTYELLHGYWPQIASSGDGTPSEVRLANILNEKPKYVVSRTAPEPWNSQRADGTIDAIRNLKEQAEGVVLVVASPTLARTLVDWNLIDEYHVAISPIVAGHGPTFLAGLQQRPAMHLLGVKTLASGVTIHRYGMRPA